MAWDLAQGWTVNQIPSPLPPLFSGDRMVVFGLLKASENASQDGKNEVRLQGTLSKDEKMEHLMTFLTPPTASACDTNRESNLSFFLHRLAAKSFIKIKQDDISGMYDGKQEFEEAKTSIISVSKSANAVSKFTSFVAVDKDNHQPVSGPLRRQVVPSLEALEAASFNLCAQSAAFACATSSIGGGGKKKTKSAGFFSLPSLGKALFGSAPPPPPAAGFGGGPSCPPPATAPFKSAPIQQSVACFGGSSSYPPLAPGAAPRLKSATLLQSVAFCNDGSSYPPAAPGAAPHEKKEAPAVLSLISLQKASGAWDLTDQLVSLCSTSTDALITACPTEIVIDTAEGKLLWATALALVLLMGKFLDQKDEWEMIAEKGKKWMKKNLPASVKYENVLKSAAAAVGVQT